MTGPLEYLARCAALQTRGLSLALVRDLERAGNHTLLELLERATDEQLDDLTRLDDARRAAAEAFGVAVVPITREPLLWDGDQA